MMPDADGGWLVRSLRAQGGSLAEVPVVLTTGSSAGREIAESLGVRALEKPFDMNRLLELVRTLAPTSSCGPFLNRAIGLEAIIDYKLLHAGVGGVAGLLFLARLLRVRRAGTGCPPHGGSD